MNIVALFGGPAGSGRSTLARAWCGTRPRAAHVELDEVRRMIVSGLADPQEESALQVEQYRVAVTASCRLARAFFEDDYDVAIDDVLEPAAFDRWWRPGLDGLPWQLVVVLPSLEETLRRAGSRAKRVREEHIRAQHGRCAEWEHGACIDTSGLDLEESTALVRERLGS